MLEFGGYELKCSDSDDRRLLMEILKYGGDWVVE